MLALNDIHTFYGESHALQGVTLSMQQGETVCLLGRNGAGKSTILKSIVGLTPIRSGSIQFEGREIGHQAPYKNARLGIALVPEDRRMFAGLTVRENLEVASYKKGTASPAWTIERIYDQYPMLAELDKRDASKLSGGQQQMLAVARSLMIEPKLLLLDEPNEGLAPVIVQQIGELIEALKSTTTILFTDQSLHFALRHAERAYILNKGQVVYATTTQELAENQEIHEKYLSVA